MTRRSCLKAFYGALAGAASRLPANRNLKWALGSNLWNYFPPVPFTEILEIMRDTGFIGIRLTQFPQILEKYRITVAQMEREVARRRVRIITISFSAAAHDPAQHAPALQRAREAMRFLARFDARHLVVFSPRRGPGREAFETMCQFYNQLGETAAEMGFKAGLHNHLDQMVQDPPEIDRCMELTDPRLFHFSPDTAHIHLAGGDAAGILHKHRTRLMLADYKDARRAGLKADFRENIFDLGDGEVDFPACHRVLRDVNFKGWLCVDLDIARKGPRASYERCGAYVVRTLEPVYA
jgi:sugar phosphate isomerase/epimerase